MLRQSVIIYILSFLSIQYANASIKDIGVPVIRNFERIEYESGTQNWSITQSGNGVMYFGNNHGLLSFDGAFWQSYPVPNGSNVRSVFYSKQNEQLYIGAFNDFGVIESDSIGQPLFVSFKPLVPEEYRGFTDVWNIYETPMGIIFQSFEAIFIYNNETIQVVEARSLFHLSYFVNGVYYVFDREMGLMELRNGFLKKIPQGEFFAHTEVWSILPLNQDEILIGTASNGLYRYDGVSLSAWETPANEMLKKFQIYSSLELDKDYLAFGTIQNGLIICDKKGNVKQIINREKGLQNNTVLSVHLDQNENLWLGLDNGIDYVELNSPITLLQDYYDFGTGYTSISFGNKLYLGTNQGLFFCDLSDINNPELGASHFKMIKNTSGQVWSLQKINDQLFCGHNNGSFVVKGAEAKAVSDIPGSWSYNEIPGRPDYFIQGTYTSMELCKFENGVMKHLNKIHGIDYSCQEVVCSPDGYIWVSHAFNGLKRFKLNETMDSLTLERHYTVDDGLPNNLFNKVKLMGNNDLLITTEKLIYKYDPTTDSFNEASFYNDLFGNNQMIYIQEDDQKNIWYVKNDNEGGVLRYLEDGTYKNVLFPFRKLKGKFIGSFFHFNSIDENNVLIALEKGFAHYEIGFVVDYMTNFTTSISSVSLLENEYVLYQGITTQKPVESDINYKQNSLRFTFSSQFYESAHLTKFSYMLDGFDETWSKWQSEPSKEYTNLPEGEYVFRVRSKNCYSVVAEAKPFSFKILPPWYKSIQAISVYFVLAAIFVWVIIFLVMRRFEKRHTKEKAELKKKYKEKENLLKQEALVAEKEIIRLRNDKLKVDMIHKDKELANSAMNLVQKNRYMNHVKEELKKLQSDVKVDSVRSRLNLIIRKLDKETANDKAWEVFETNFDDVHEDFIKRLRKEHPDVTPKELKLAAFLRMNISSKEIATLLNITTRGVEISRYRLRKKFNLDRTQNLTDYILSI